MSREPIQGIYVMAMMDEKLVEMEPVGLTFSPTTPWIVREMEERAA